MSEQPESTIEEANEIITREDAILPERQEENTEPSHGVNLRISGRSKLMDTLTWACVLIWAGAVLLAGNLGVLAQLLSRYDTAWMDTPWALPVSGQVWTVLFLGLGAILLVGVLVRLLVPAVRYDILGNSILVIVAFAVAFGRADLIWPLILIALGIAVILRRK